MDHIIGQNLTPTHTGDTPAGSAPIISEGSQATFMQDVIEASRTVPVLVDFWAEWCGPCKQLAPVLEKVVTAAKGRVRLVKIDIEANRALTAQLTQVGLPLQSIPMVAAFWKGQILDLFQGALPESEIKKFVEGVLKAAGGGTLPATELLAEADVALETSQPERAAELYSAVIGEEPENPKAWAGLIRAMLALDDEEAASAALADVPAKIAEAPEVAGARAALELKREGRKAAQEMEGVRARLAANPEDHEARCELATALNAAGQHAEAAEELLHIIKTDRDWNNGAARQQLLRFFEAWGHMDPATLAARRKLSSLLFS
ncbi:thioredoxin family protein [Acetobacter orientalis]|uniref:Thioredoxin n=1 Tax=Acetobacter orientalis TaxID=146474 RepID=A0A252BF40_9PROT|nr:co-chaperone YbbN [Acetobacter orientalis]MCP1215295.1 co-chaperone YbbN [Acetobacter orientalis]MCP1218878.1 co-chaperone YbbN [Acetobacter orientalis]OUJ02920.1 thioredoxin [Acetobacter orientalis]